MSVNFGSEGGDDRADRASNHTEGSRRAPTTREREWRECETEASGESGEKPGALCTRSPLTTGLSSRDPLLQQKLEVSTRQCTCSLQDVAQP